MVEQLGERISLALPTLVFVVRLDDILIAR
jgi:hypothetical protein